MSDLTLIRVTCPNQRVANSIAEKAVEQRLAACGNVEGPMMSTYRWKGVIEQSWEFVLWLKAPAENFTKIETLVKAEHPYDVPGMVALPCTAANASYASWVTENTDT